MYKMECEIMRVPELKSLARYRELRKYSRMRKLSWLLSFGHLGWNYSPLCGRMYYVRFKTPF